MGVSREVPNDTSIRLCHCNERVKYPREQYFIESLQSTSISLLISKQSRYKDT